MHLSYTKQLQDFLIAHRQFSVSVLTHSVLASSGAAL
jgi:hypothetical protein